MGDFAYQAYRKDGTLVTGQLSAPDAAAARHILRGRGLIPGDVSDDPGARAVQPPSGGAGQVRLADLVSWSSRMAALITGGVPLDRALDISLPTPPVSAMDRAGASMLQAVRNGEALSGAARQAGLPGEVCGILAAAEMTGDPGRAFAAIAAGADAALTRRRAILSALTYPMLLVCVAIAAFFFMLIGIIPRFEPIFARATNTLPALTQNVLGLSVWVRANGVVLAAGAAAVVGVGLIAWRSGALRRLLARAMGGLPVLGAIRHRLLLAGVLERLANFLSAGVATPEALRLAAGTVEAPAWRTGLHTVCDRVQTGELLSDAFASVELLDQDTLTLLRAGEASGALVGMLQLSARTAQTRADAAIKRALLVLEPLLVLLIGGMIGGMILSIFQAVLSINDVVL